MIASLFREKTVADCVGWTGFRPTILALTGAFLLGCGGGTEVEVAKPYRAEIRESFTEPAKTRLEKTHQITMPVAGRIGRIDLEPGDSVSKGQELAEFDLAPLQHAVDEARAAVAELEASIVVKEDNRLEQTALVEANAMVNTASETLKASDAQVEAETARAERATKELERTRKLAKEEAVTQQKLEDVELEAETALIELRRQEFYKAALRAFNVAVHLGPGFVNQYVGKKDLEREVLVSQLTQARARLAQAEHDLGLASVVSPVDGLVLERFEQGDDTLSAGTPLLLLGNLDLLEVEADVLTQDALLLSPSSEVSLEPASRLDPIAGRVKRIEPAGFTKLSSLGVEQQRVKVIVSLEDKVEGLGVGYRLQARFFTGTKQDALIVPRFSVLQAPDGFFYVLWVVDGEIRKKTVKIGLRSDLELEVTEGLDEDADLVAHPDTTLREGAKVKALSD
jgi:HlyD family secretion protein